MIDDGRVRDFGKSMEKIEEDYVRRAYGRYQRYITSTGEAAK